MPVRRLRGDDLVVPSVVHWKVDHYAAITKIDRDVRRVVDPTFGRARLFAKEVVNLEASGYFLVPPDRVPTGWKRLTDAEASAVFGKGYPADMPNEHDEPCEEEPLSEKPVMAEDPVQGCFRVGGSSANSTNASPCGMPLWRVSEPFINLC